MLIIIENPLRCGSKKIEKLTAIYIPKTRDNKSVISFIRPFENPFIRPYKSRAAIAISKEFMGVNILKLYICVHGWFK